MKEIEVDCPCCDSRLLIDVRTQSVLRHTPMAELDEFGKPKRNAAAWDRAQAKVTERKGRGTDAFDDALSREKERTQDLDALFDRAKDKVQKRKDELDQDA